MEHGIAKERIISLLAGGAVIVITWLIMAGF